VSLTTCRECQAQVSTEAASCPHCGAPNPVAAVNRAPLQPATKRARWWQATRLSLRAVPWWAWGVLAVVILLRIISSLGGNADSRPDALRSAANRIGTDCRMNTLAPSGRTSRDALDAFAAIRNGDQPGFNALIASGRAGVIPEGTFARIIAVEGVGDLAYKVRVMSGPQIGREAWVFMELCD
jgi:hypothetical protein